MTLDQLQDIATQLVTFLAAGTVLPLFVALVNQSGWPRQARQAVMIVSAVVLGTLTYLAQNGWEVADASALVGAILAIIAAAQAAYHLLWQRGGITQAIEGGTSRRKTPADPADYPIADE